MVSRAAIAISDKFCCVQMLFRMNIGEIQTNKYEKARLFYIINFL